MRLFKKSGSHKLEPAWSYATKGVIWRIYPASGGTLVGEERRIEEKKALFFCLDQKNGQELWQHASPGDAWWVGIEAVYRDTVFFHGFATPNLPLHRGIIATDVLTGKTLWENQELEFVGTRDECVIGSRETTTGRVFGELDRRTGAVRRNFDAAESHLPEVSNSGSDVDLTLPLPVEHLASGDPQRDAAIRNHMSSGALTGSVEVVEHERFIIFDYTEPAGEGESLKKLYSNVIKVVDRNTGTVAYIDRVSTGMQTVTPELFFVQHDTLYYIKERRTITAVRLAS